DVRAAATTHHAPLTTHHAPLTTHPIPISPIRRTIAERMLASVRATVPVTLTTTADATNLVNLRNQFKAVAPTANEPVRSSTDFLANLPAVALQAHPMLNPRWNEEQIIVLPEIHIAVAVDPDLGLLAPVIRSVPQLTLRQVAEQARDLADRARQRKLK